MKPWIAAFATVIMFIGPAYAQDYVPGLYDGRSISGWTFYTNTNGTSVWVRADGSSSSTGAACGVTRLSGVATDRDWQSATTFSAEDFAANISGAGQGGIVLRPGSRIDRIVLAGHPALRHEMAVFDGRREKKLLTWWVSGVEATLQLNCATFAENYAQSEPSFESFAGAFGVLTTAPQ